MASGQFDFAEVSTMDLLNEVRRRYAILSQPQQNVLLFGTPLSGKWTIADSLKRSMGLCQIDWSTAKSKINWQTMRLRNADQSDEAALKFIKEEMMTAQCRRGFILHGYPETLDQAKKLDTMLEQQGTEIDYSINLSSTEEVAKKRADGRLFHTDSGRRYHAKHNRPREDGIDDFTGERLNPMKRDEIENVEKRFAACEEALPALMAHYEKKGTVLQVDGAASLKELYVKLHTYMSNWKRESN